MAVGFPDQLRSAILNRPIQEIRQDLATASIEVVTGRKSELAAALGARSGEYSLISKALKEIDSDLNRLRLGEARLNAIEIPIRGQREQLNGFATQYEATLNTKDVTTSGVRSAAREQVESLLSSLGANYAGRSLFSGDAVDTPAVVSNAEFFTQFEAAIAGATDETSLDAAITAFFADGGGFDTDVYQGGDDLAAAIRLPDGGTVDFEIRATDPAFKSALEGLVRLSYADETTSDSFFRSAFSQIRQGETGLIALESSIGRQQNRVGQAITGLQQEQLILGETEDRYAGVDPYEAATRLTNLEVQLEAAYTVTARITQLKLTNFI